MRYNPEIHHRRSIRLKGYDYSSNGSYFITINTQNRECFFGDIIDAEMVLNDAGRMIEKWYNELPNKFPGVELDEYGVMPDHFHCIVVIDNIVGQTRRSARTGVLDADCIIENKNDSKHVGAHLRVRPIIPNDENFPIIENDSNIDLKIDDNIDSMIGNIIYNEMVGQTRGSARTGEEDNIIYNADIPRIMQWFKTMSTNEYIRGVKDLGWMPFNKRMWQRNYYEHIIRDDGELERIRNYIINNPLNWKDKKNDADYVSDIYEIYASSSVRAHLRVRPKKFNTERKIENANALNTVRANLRVRPIILNNEISAINENYSNIDYDNNIDAIIENNICNDTVGQTRRSARTGVFNTECKIENANALNTVRANLRVRPYTGRII